MTQTISISEFKTACHTIIDQVNETGRASFSLKEGNSGRSPGVRAGLTNMTLHAQDFQRSEFVFGSAIHPDYKNHEQLKKT